MNIQKKYLSRFKKALPKSLPQKTVVIQQMEQTLNDYIETTPNTTLDNIIQDLGSPETIASAYFENQVSDELRYIHRKHTLTALVIILFFIGLLFAGVVYVYEYWPTTSIYETAVENYNNVP